MSVGIKTYVSLFAHIREESMTAQDLSHMTGLHLKTVRDFLREAHRQNIVHITQWDQRYNHRVKLPMYKLGAGRNEPRPKPLDRAVIIKRWRETQKARQAFNPFDAMCRVAVPKDTDSL